MIVTSDSAEATRALGERLGAATRAPLTIGLRGDLGVGKTVFTQGLAAGLGVSEPVVSPTYMLIRSYAGRLPLHHCDWYRHAAADDVESSGFFDLEPGVVVVEWQDKFSDLLQSPILTATIAMLDAETRRVEFAFDGCDDLRAALDVEPVGEGAV